MTQNHLRIYIAVDETPTIETTPIDWDWFIFDYKKNKDTFIREHIVPILHNHFTPRVNDLPKTGAATKLYFKHDGTELFTAQYWSHIIDMRPHPTVVISILKSMLDYLIDQVQFKKVGR